MQELYVLQFRFIGDSFRYLVSDLTSFVNADFTKTINNKTISFVIFIISISLGYLALWLPFMIKLSRDVSFGMLLCIL